jgi:hypothetical protein
VNCPEAAKRAMVPNIGLPRLDAVILSSSINDLYKNAQYSAVNIFTCGLVVRSLKFVIVRGEVRMGNVQIPRNPTRKVDPCILYAEFNQLEFNGRASS